MKKIIILFFFYTIGASAQNNLRYIPDSNLRKELANIGYTVNDSLDISEILEVEQLILSDNNISNLNGLQYFKNLKTLTIDNNRLTNLKYLPPNLINLYCKNNKITSLGKLPAKLEILFCDSNNISRIENLPKTLKYLNFASNKMKYFPKLPAGIEFVNYRFNNIPKSKLPEQYINMDCKSQYQNCLPNSMMKWDILNSKSSIIPANITGMLVKFTSDYSWGGGSLIEKIDFKRIDSMLISEKSNYFRSKNRTDSSYSETFSSHVNISAINKLIKDIYTNEMNVKISVDDSLITIDLSRKFNKNTMASACMDCTDYLLEYFIYDEKDTLHLSYSFTNLIYEGLDNLEKANSVNIKPALDWLYIYKIINLTIANHELAKKYFNVKNLMYLADWVNKAKDVTN